MTVYEQVLNRGVEHDHHASDLYLKDGKQARQIIEGWEFAENATMFRSQIDGSLWWDLPFAYDPWWAAKRNSIEQVGI